MIGKTVSHYRILEKLGVGGMGVVYRAEDTQLKRTVALKFLPPELTFDPEAKERFLQEARAASALQHATLCTIHDIGETPDGQMFICMDFYDGETLNAALRHGPLSVDRAIDIAIQICQGLSRAHEAGIIHRDIKPANIMVTRRGEVKILDFGLAKLAGQTRLTKTGTTLGTAAYMSPEQTRSADVDWRSDLWSVGVVLYEMLAGRRPFESDYEQAIAYAVCNEQPVSLSTRRPDMPPGVEPVVFKAMSKNPAERYQSADDLLSELKILQGGEHQAGVTLAGKLAAQRRWRTRLIRLSAGGLTVALIWAGYLFFSRNAPEKELAYSPKAITVLSFENQTGDISQEHLGVVLQDAIITSLEQSPYFRVTTRERIRDILKQLGRKNTDSIDNQTGLEICAREGSEAMVTGSFTRAGELFVTNLKIVDVSTRQTMKTFRESGKGVESLLETQIDDLCNKISRGFGVSEHATQQTLRPVGEMITASLEAYDYYVSGQREYEKTNIEEARRCYEKAVRIDSTFALAWWHLSTVVQSGAREEAENHARRWLQKTPEKDRLHAEAHLYPERYWATIRSAIAKYPREKEFHLCLATEGYTFQLRDYSNALAEYKKALDLDPEYYWPLEALSGINCALGHPEEGLKYAQRYHDLYPTNAPAVQLMGDAYFGLGDIAMAGVQYREARGLKAEDDVLIEFRRMYMLALDEEYAQAESLCDERIALSSRPWARFGGLLWKAWLQAWLGKAGQAAETCRRAQAADPSNYFPLLQTAWILTDAKNTDSARMYLARSSLMLESIQDSIPRYAGLSWHALVAGLAATTDCRPESAQAELSDMMAFADKTDEVARGRRRHLGDLLHAGILFLKDSVDQTIVIAAGATPWKSYFDYDFNWDDRGMMIWNFAWSLRDLLAKAYGREGKIDRAIAEYERLTARNPNGRRQFLIHPLYHYRLARLYEQKGMKLKAIAEHEAFLRIWGKADPVHKEPADARKKLVSLKAIRP